MNTTPYLSNSEISQIFEKYLKLRYKPVGMYFSSELPKENYDININFSIGVLLNMHLMHLDLVEAVFYKPIKDVLVVNGGPDSGKELQKV